MSKRALPQLGAVIDARKARIARDLDEATAMQQRADAAAAAHEKTLADARAKAQSLAQAARDRLAAEAEAKRKALEGELAAKLAAAERQIAATRAQAMTNVDGIAREAAARSSSVLVGRPADPAAIAAAVNSVKSSERSRMMEFGAEFFVLLGFLVFLCVLGYLGAHRIVLKALDARGKAIAGELAQAAKLREEATALLASFEKKAAEAEANAAAIVAEARAQAEQLAEDAAERHERFHRPAHQAGRGQDRACRGAGRRGRTRRRGGSCRDGRSDRAARPDARVRGGRTGVARDRRP